MKEIVIERYKTPKVEAYKITGEKTSEFVGLINNEHEFNKFRNQMLLNEVTDKYYFLWKDKKITVDEKGNMSDFPSGLYDQVNKELAKTFALVKANEAKYKATCDKYNV